jgi:predicted RND superfamily exporter protein
LRRYFEFVTSHPIPVLVLCGAITLVFGAFVLRITREPSPDAFIPPDFPALERKKHVEEDFGLKEPIVVAVFRDAPGGIFDPYTLRLIRDISSAIQQLPEIEADDVLSVATESGVYFEDDEPGFEPLMKEVPETPEALDSLKRDILGYELYNGTLVAGDGSAACIVIRSQGEKADDEIYRKLKKLLEDFPVRDERLMVAGEAAVRSHMGVAVSDDALRMNFVCPVVMALLIILAYRTVRGTILPLSVIGGASAAALGLMSAMGVPIYIITNGIFVIIMALGVADSIHLIGQYYEEQLVPRGRSKQDIIVDACMALWYPLLFTSLTDVAGFFTLYLVGIMPPIRYFGLFTCAGVIGALFFSYSIVPAGLMVVPLKMCKPFSRRTTSTTGADSLDVIGRITGRLGSAAYHKRGTVIAVSVVIIAFAFWGGSKLIVNDARILAFKDDHAIVNATRAINERFDGTSYLNIVATASEEGALIRPGMLRKIEALEAYTETLPHVGGTHSLSGWVKRAHQKSNNEDPAFYAIPEDESDTRFYLDVLSGSGSPMARLLLEVTDKSYTRANLIIRITSSEFIHQKEVVEKLQEYLDDRFNDESIAATLGGRADLDYHWIKLVRTSHIKSIFISLGCVLAMTSFMFRSAFAGLLCGLTVGIAILLNYAVMGLGGIPLGVGTSMFASIAIGAGVDFPIHILDRFRVSVRSGKLHSADIFRSTLAFTGRAMFFTSMIVAIGFLLLSVSEFRTLNRFGLLIGLGMVFSFLASVTLLPALVAAMKPRFIWGGPERRDSRGERPDMRREAP